MGTDIKSKQQHVFGIYVGHSLYFFNHQLWLWFYTKRVAKDCRKDGDSSAIKVWHDHSNAEGHSTLLASVAFSTISISIGRLVVQEIHLILNRLKIFLKNVLGSWIAWLMAKKRTEVLQRISPGETDMCVFGMSFYAITAHLGIRPLAAKRRPADCRPPAEEYFSR